MSSDPQDETMKYKQVALAIYSHEYTYGQRKLQGIIEYYRRSSAWMIHRNALSQPFVKLSDLEGWKGDGVIAEIYGESDTERLLSLGLPVVNTSSAGVDDRVPSVSTDNHAIGRMAAEHLVGSNVDRFAFIGPEGLFHSRERFDGFSKTLESMGCKCDALFYEPLAVRHEDSIDPRSLLDAVASLETPVGVMASSDRVGFSVLEACRLLGLRSPEDVSVIGVDDEKIYTQLAFATMTSIRPAAHQVGFRAAQMLDDLISGKELEEKHILIPPNQIVQRDSTDTIRSKYPEVTRALRFIRSHDSEFIDVTSVLDVVPVSRRRLEVKFKEEVGHGIYQEIRRVRVERAKKLLSTTDWAESQIARESGFMNKEGLVSAFQKLVGMSVEEYRDQTKGKAG